MLREYEDYLNDISDAIKKIEIFIKGLEFDDFKKDDKTKFAVIRALEIIGEATKNIPDDIRNKHPKIPWKDMAGLRDVLIHGYFGVDEEIVWLTIKEKIPEIKPKIESILKKLSDEKS